MALNLQRASVSTKLQLIVLKHNFSLDFLISENI